MHQKEEDKMPELTPLISPDAFLNIFEAGDLGTVEHEVVEAQEQHQSTMEQWEKTLPIESETILPLAPGSPCNALSWALS